jgi:enoyl-CoA hydratase
MGAVVVVVDVDDVVVELDADELPSPSAETALDVLPSEPPAPSAASAPSAPTEIRTARRTGRARRGIRRWWHPGSPGGRHPFALWRRSPAPEGDERRQSGVSDELARAGGLGERSAMADLVIVDKPQPHTSVVTLNRPERLNAMSIDLVIELDEALEQVGNDNDTYVVVLTGAGRGFCSGLDLKDYGVIPNIDGLQVGRIAQRSMRYYSQLISRMRRMPQPVLAAINGAAYGGGMCLSLAAEMRIAAESAEFNSTGIVNGLTSTELGASWLLPRLIGAAHSNDLLLTGRRVGADEALRMGLVSRVLPDDELLPEVLALAARMCEFSPYGLQMTKEIIWVNLENPSLEAAIEIEDRNQLMLGFTENLPEAIRAFDRKRSPVYTDEPRKDLFAGPAAE